MPKVIDFGVAKATGQKLTEQTMFTEFGQIVGTLEYMVPEQADLNNLDIDTRADIYSLGVLLYELLTGTTPFTAEHSAGRRFAEMLRIIREVEPPKPSTRLSAETLPVDRGQPATGAEEADPAAPWRPGLDRHEVPGEGARPAYETANGLAVDIERYLTSDRCWPARPRPDID